MAKLYLRTADYSMKKSCGIYELKSEKGRTLYKIFSSNEELRSYLKKNKEKICKKWNLFLRLKSTKSILIRK